MFSPFATTKSYAGAKQNISRLYKNEYLKLTVWVLADVGVVIAAIVEYKALIVTEAVGGKTVSWTAVSVASINTTPWVELRYL